MAYPTGTDLADFLIAQGVIDAAPEDLADYDEQMEAAIEAFEAAVRWSPFLSTGLSATKSFNPNPDDRTTLYLPWGVLSVTVVQIGSTVLTADQWSLGGQWGNDGPYTQIILKSGWTCADSPVTVQVTGVFGFTAALTARQRRTIYKMASQEIWTQLNSPSGTIKKEKTGPVEVTYSDGAGGKIGGWQADITSAIDDLRRVGVW